MKIVRKTVEVPKDKYAWSAVISNLPKTEDKPNRRDFFFNLKKDLIL